MRQSPEYGVSAALVGAELEILLTFKKDRAYCCSQWGCHLPLVEGRRWEKLHQSLALSGVAAPPRLRLILDCRIEEGAVFFDLSRPDPKRRGWYAFAPVAARDYHVVSVEADIA